MCNHTLGLYRSWDEADDAGKRQYRGECLNSIAIGGGLGVPTVADDDLRVQSLQQLAASYIGLFPDRADQLKIEQLSCNGHERTFTLSAGSVFSAEELRQWAQAMWEALQTYSQPSYYDLRLNKENCLWSPATNDAGEVARNILTNPTKENN